MKTSEFDFPLPADLIAERPLKRRDGSRLLVLGRDGSVKHRRFYDLPGFLQSGDMLLLNNTRVMPARLRGRKRNGRELEILLTRNVSGRKWEIMSRGRYTGPLEISGAFRAEIYRGETAELHHEGDLGDVLREAGEMPLPPYIRRRAGELDRERYQTVYAEHEGSIAAPTAGLHFTKGLLKKLEEKGVLIRYLTLHVGRGTFTPIRAERLEEHRMEEEAFEMPSSLADEIRSLKGSLIAVGTTTTRAVEGFMSNRFAPSAASGNGVVRGGTDIFIRPGYRFRAVSGLLTNFHLPRSTPLMLASALSGGKNLLRAYAEAVDRSYRFFSYGDAMLIK